MYQLKFLGYIAKAHGLHGAFKLKMASKVKISFEKMKSVFLEIDGQFIPYKIENIKLSNPLIVKIKDLNSIEEINKLKACKLFVEKIYIKETDIKESSFEGIDLVGYKVEDKFEGEIGFVEDSIDNHAEGLLVVDYAGKEVLIPIVEDLIIELDNHNKCIKTNLPEGLLSINS